MDIIIYAIIIFVIAFFFFGGTLGKNKLSYQQIFALAQNAGFSDSDAAIATAIALAESGGDANAYNPETEAQGGTPEGLGSYGLWQIYLKKHPEFAGMNLKDPQINANAAFDIYIKIGNRFTAWSTFNSNKYESYLA